MAKISLVRHRMRTTEILDLVYTDVCSIFDVQVRDGYLYFVIFIDGFSWYRHMCETQIKAFEKFKEFK